MFVFPWAAFPTVVCTAIAGNVIVSGFSSQAHTRYGWCAESQLTREQADFVATTSKLSWKIVYTPMSGIPQTLSNQLCSVPNPFAFFPEYRVLELASFIGDPFLSWLGIAHWLPLDVNAISNVPEGTGMAEDWIFYNSPTSGRIMPATRIILNSAVCTLKSKKKWVKWT